jgi:type II secretory pathway pseudopilin PulG
LKSHRGFALAAALLVVVLIAVLVTAAVFTASQETHATSSEVLHQQVGAYAERAALLAVAGWSCPECDQLPVGSVLVRNPEADPPLESTVFITRLDSALFLVTGEGRAASTSPLRIRRRVSIVITSVRDSSGVARATRVSEQAWSAAYQM